MKTTFTCILLAAFLNAGAQTFSPAVTATGTGKFKYDFTFVKTNTTKNTLFTIANVANGTPFEVTLDEIPQAIESPDAECDIYTNGNNYSITSADKGVISGGKGTFTITFIPQEYSFNAATFITVSDWDGTKQVFDGCETKVSNSFQKRMATATITLGNPVNKTFEVALEGTNTSTITALDNTVISNTTKLVLTNPVKDVLTVSEFSTVFDSYGKALLSGQGAMSVVKLQPGVYFVKAGTRTEKIVKE